MPFSLNRRRVGAIVGISLFAFLLVLGGAFVGFQAGIRMPKTILVKGVTGIDNREVSADFGTFWQAWETIEDLHLKDKDVNAQEKVYGAISGLVGSLEDPYSDFFKPSDSKQFQDDIRGSFGGIGAELGIRKNQLLIIAPLKNTPASKAGLKAGDKILRVNSTSTDGISIDDAVRMIRGKEGTSLTLTIFRDSWERPKDIKIVREQITVPTLDFEMKEGDIGYLHLYSFNRNAGSLFYQAMVEASTQGARGLILDLRNNPGGYLEAAVNLAGWFLPRGTLVVSEEGREGVMDQLRANGNAALADFPVVVLINQGSASASEILAGALRDSRKVKLIGEQSFGKGTVQQLTDLRDGSSLKLTIAHWVLPSGAILEGKGLMPDIEVKKTDEDEEKKRDPQLDKAIEVLKQEMKKAYDGRIFR
ncbi:MAG: S41 family peptidase [Candidatus Liptonbacteria bacterium]|nr:S41 family peptidase [Candidatus Liptonbacteria bacterium]